MKPKILFICTYNMMRSKTAEVIYLDDERFDVKSAGIDDAAEVKLNRELLEWADYIVVMENYHRMWLREQYPVICADREIISLDIPDMYEFMDPELISELQKKVEDVFRERLG